MPRDFRVNAKNIFLTYPQAFNIISKELLHAFLLSKGPSKCIVSREEHQDGNQHFHCLLGWDDKKNIQSATYFDYQGHHPNIQAARNTRKTIKYIVKDGDFINQGWVVQHDAEDIFEVLHELVQQGGNATEIIRETIGRTGTRGLKLYNQIAAYADRMTRPQVVYMQVKDYPADFRVMDICLLAKIQAFIADFMQGCADRGQRKSLWLHGASRLGKTVLARSLGTHWYMNCAWNVDQYSDEAEYGVLDDIPWESLKYYYKGLLGCQKDVTVTDKYKKKSVIKGGKPVIILTNKLPDFTGDEWEWLNANVSFHQVVGQLY